MPREKVIGKCSACGEEKPLFDVKNKLCGSCAGKKGGGRPKALQKKPAAASSENPQNADLPRQNSSSKTRAAGATGQDTVENSGGEEYFCEGCGKKLRYGQRKCSCGIFPDWRGTPVVDDPDLVVCPECGCVAGHTGQVEICPHCNFGG